MQLFFGLAKIRYANGHEWAVTPNPAALSGDAALGLARPEIPRALVAVTSVSGSTAPACYDEQRKAYSLGAVGPIRGEPGRFARCVSGQWIETQVR